MNGFTVVWKPSQAAKLAELWSNATDRGAVTNAANEIESVLKDKPLTAGESRLGSYRVLLVKPLGVVFEVSEADRLVSVLKVWAY